jgi:ribosomal protein S13
MRHTNRSSSYVVKNQHSYCFRQGVPLDLQEIIGKKELRYSLKTVFPGIANSRARIIAGKIQLLFNGLRKGDSRLMKLTEEQIKELIGKYVKAALKNLDERVFEDPFGSDYPPPFVDKSSMDSYVDSLDDIKQDWVTHFQKQKCKTVS